MEFAEGFILICTTLASTLSFGQAGNAPMQTLPNFPALWLLMVSYKGSHLLRVIGLLAPAEQPAIR